MRNVEVSDFVSANTPFTAKAYIKRLVRKVAAADKTVDVAWPHVVINAVRSPHGLVKGLSRAFGVSASTVLRYYDALMVSLHGRDWRRREWSAADDSELRLLYLVMPDGDIGIRMGRSRLSVRLRLVHLGLSRPVDNPFYYAPESQKVSARMMVADAVSSGVLRRMPCEVCGKRGAHAHHEDYGKPLDVVWLCGSHHAKRHAEINKEKRRNERACKL